MYCRDGKTGYGYEDTHILVTGLEPPDVREIRCAVSGSLERITSNTASGDTNTTFSLPGPVNLPSDDTYDITIEVCSGGGIGVG